MVIRAGAQTGSEKNGRALGQKVGRAVGESLESISIVEQPELSDSRSVGSGGQTSRSEKAGGRRVRALRSLFV